MSGSTAIRPSSAHASAAFNSSTSDRKSRRQTSYIIPPQRFDSPFQDLAESSPHESRSIHSVKTARRESRPPTGYGGPLSSHPTNDFDDVPPIQGAYPPSITNKQHSQVIGAMSSESARDTSGSFVAPNSPSTTAQEAQMPGRRPSGVRRLFSLSSLRQSFSSSRTSFSIPPGSSYGSRPEMQGSGRPQTAMSYTPSVQAPSMYTSNNQTSLRKKRSSNWFKRKSGFFAMNEDGTLESVDEDTHNRQAKRLKENRLPVLPEVSTLVELNEGSLGWDDAIFKKE